MECEGGDLTPAGGAPYPNGSVLWFGSLERKSSTSNSHTHSCTHARTYTHTHTHTPCKQRRYTSHWESWPHSTTHTHGRRASESLARECSAAGGPPQEELEITTSLTRPYQHFNSTARYTVKPWFTTTQGATRTCSANYTYCYYCC